MKTVSNEAQEAMAHLIEWEMMGQDDVDLKQVLRSLSLADLSVVQANIDAIPGIDRFASVRLVRCELEYRLGRITEWRYLRVGSEVELIFQPTQGIDYIQVNLKLDESTHE